MNRPRSSATLSLIILGVLVTGVLPAAVTEVYVAPEGCHLGGVVEISGWVRPTAGGSAGVRLEIFPPAAGKSLVKNLRSQRDGTFTFSFSGTDRTGVWRVVALKTGTNERAKTQFEVTAGLFFSSLVDHLEQHADIANRAATNLRNQITGYPDFAGKQQMINDSETLRQQLQTLQQQVIRLGTESARLENRLKSNPSGIPEDARKALRMAAEKSAGTSAYLAAESERTENLLEQSRQAAEWCHQWQLYCDLMQRLNRICNYLATSLEEIAVNLLVARGTSGLDFATAQAIGTVSNIIGSAVMGASVVGILSFAASTFTGLSAALFQELVSAFCTLFEGKVEGSYRAELLHRDMPFFTQHYRLVGTIKLVFQKRRPGDPGVYLKGDIRATVEDITCTMTMVPFDLAGATVLCGCRPALPPLASRATMLQLEGDAHSDRLAITLTGTSRDFALRAKGYYVIIGAHSPLPVPGTLEFPLMDGEWFFTRTTRLSQPDTDELVIPITIQGDKSVAEETYEREIYLPATARRTAVRVTMRLTIRLSN